MQAHHFALPCARCAVETMATAPVAVAELLQPTLCCTANRAPATQHSHWGKDCSGDPAAGALQSGGCLVGFCILPGICRPAKPSSSGAVAKVAFSKTAKQWWRPHRCLQGKYQSCYPGDFLP